MFYMSPRICISISCIVCDDNSRCMCVCVCVIFEGVLAEAKVKPVISNMHTM